MDSRKPAEKKPRRNKLIGDEYREVIEHAADLDEVIPELELARTTDEQLELYHQASERIAREGPA